MKLAPTDASLVPAPKQPNTESEKEAIKEGKSAREIWPDEPAKAAQKDVDARWTLKIGGKVRHRPDGTLLPMIATPVFGYKSHISIDPRSSLAAGAGIPCCRGQTGGVPPITAAGGLNHIIPLSRTSDFAPPFMGGKNLLQHGRQK